MKIRKIIAGLASVALMASMTGCGSSAGDTAATTAAAAETTAKDTTPITTEKIDVADIEEVTMDTGAIADEEAVAADFKELYGDQTIELTIYSQLANYSGKLTGWFATLMKNKYNCEITIIPESDGTFDTRMESGNLGDIVIFGSDGDTYQRAAKEGMLFNWNDEDLLTNYGAYIKANMPYALKKNQNLNASIGAGDVIYGFGHNVASSTKDHEAFFYTSDIRWDLYKQLDYPEVNTLDDLEQLMVSMKEICPKDENGNETYAVSMWPDWDGNMVMYPKAFATCYYGYDEMGFGLYDGDTGTFHYALEDDGPYLKSLKFFNKLYQDGLVDPDSMTQTYEKMSEKAQAGGIFMSIFDYAGSALYNSEGHLSEGKAMYPMVPKETTPLCYGMNVMGGNRLWTIGANTEYPELCMAIINYLTTPEGYLTYLYGPKDVCWYYNDQNQTCLTELGEAAVKDRKGTTMPDEWGGNSFNDGTFQANNTTWSKDATNPETGERYNCDTWASRLLSTDYDILLDWRKWASGQAGKDIVTSQQYMDSCNHKTTIASAYSESNMSDDLKIIWEQVATCIKAESWKAIYAKDDAEFDSIIEGMKKSCEEYDPNGQCLEWCNNEAAIRYKFEQDVQNS